MQVVNHSHEVLVWGIRERSVIKKEMDHLNLRLENVNQALLAVMRDLNMKNFQHADFGTLVLKAAVEAHGIDKAKLVEAMLGAGVDAEKVKEIMAAADKPTTRKASVSYTPYGGKEDES